MERLFIDVSIQVITGKSLFTGHSWNNMYDVAFFNKNVIIDKLLWDKKNEAFWDVLLLEKNLSLGDKYVMSCCIVSPYH